MCEKNVDCPFCIDGKTDLKIVTNGNETTQKIDCIYCKGTKKLSQIALNKINAELEWLDKHTCKCKTNSAGVYYVADNVDENCSKHHWKCKECNKIVQIG